MNQFEYTVTTDKPFSDAVAGVEKKATEMGFRVLHTHDFAATLAEKGFPREPLKLVEICNAKYASQVLEKDVKLSLMLPCPISIYVDGGKDAHQHAPPDLHRSFLSQCRDRRRGGGRRDRGAQDCGRGSLNSHAVV